MIESEALSRLLQLWRDARPEEGGSLRIMSGGPMAEALDALAENHYSPRVWFDDETIPNDVRVLDEDGEVHWPGEDCAPDEPCAMIGFGPLVEIALPDHAVEVARERARRAAAGEDESGALLIIR